MVYTTHVLVHAGAGGALDDLLLQTLAIVPAEPAMSECKRES